MKIGYIRISTDTTTPTVFATVAERRREGIADVMLHRYKQKDSKKPLISSE